MTLNSHLWSASVSALHVSKISPWADGPVDSTWNVFPISTTTHMHILTKTCRFMTVLGTVDRPRLAWWRSPARRPLFYSKQKESTAVEEHMKCKKKTIYCAFYFSLFPSDLCEGEESVRPLQNRAVKTSKSGFLLASTLRARVSEWGLRVWKPSSYQLSP